MVNSSSQSGYKAAYSELKRLTVVSLFVNRWGVIWIDSNELHCRVMRKVPHIHGLGQAC